LRFAATNSGEGIAVTSMENNSSKRRGRAVLVLLVLIFAALLVAGMVSAFKLGVANGMATAGAGLILYHVLAAFYDWPRLTLDDVFAFFEAVFDWFLGLFGW
jgi:hypothetical protein